MKIEPNKYYIDRRLGIDVTKTNAYYRGRRWLLRGYEPEFIREVIINENGFFVEVNHEQPS